MPAKKTTKKAVKKTVKKASVAKKATKKVTKKSKKVATKKTKKVSTPAVETKKDVVVVAPVVSASGVVTMNPVQSDLIN